MEPKKNRDNDYKEVNRNKNADALEKEIGRVDEHRRKEIERQTKEYGRRSQDWGRKAKVTPWLLIRHHLDDMGLRPIPSGIAHYLSPDITIQSTDALGNPVADEDNFIHARIFNLGAVGAAPVKVDFYWGDPSIGLSAAHMNLVGTEWVEVDSLNAVDVKCKTPWVPSLSHGTHQCLMVNCTNHILDPILHPFQARQDRHAGQRNVTVKEASSGEFLSFSLKLNNVFPFKSQQVIRLRTQRMKLVPGAAQMALPDIITRALIFGDVQVYTRANMVNMFQDHPRKLHLAKTVSRFLGHREESREKVFEEVKTSRTPSVKTIISEEVRYVKNPRADDLLANHLIANKYTERSVCHNEKVGTASERLKMNAFEQRSLNVEIQIPEDAGKGEFIAFHFLQETRNLPVGGYSILVKVV